MKTEYMMRTRESKQDKQRVEVERDNALIKIEVLNQEKVSSTSNVLMHLIINVYRYPP